jgi:hypothetical protein
MAVKAGPHRVEITGEDGVHTAATVEVGEDATQELLGIQVERRP